MSKSNLSNLTNKEVKFVATNQSSFIDTFKDTGEYLIVTKNQFEPGTNISEQFHDIYVSGEHIAGGYGLSNEEYRDRLTYLANINNYNKLIAVINEIGEYVEPDTDDDKETSLINVDPNNSTIIANNTTYQLIFNKSSNILLFEKTRNTEIIDVSFTFNYNGNNIDYNKSYIEENGPIILEAGETINIVQVNFTTLGTKELEGYSLNDVNDIPLLKYTTNDDTLINNTEFVINCNDNPISLTSDTSKKNTLVANVKELSGQYYISNIGEYIYWQLPYFYGCVEMSTANYNDYGKPGSETDGKGTRVLRSDTIFDNLISTEFTITHDKDTSSHGYFYCPKAWVNNYEPNLVLKQSNISFTWIKKEISIFINSKYVPYVMFKTKQKYTGDVKWIIY